MANENKRRPQEGWRQLSFKTVICVPTTRCTAIFFFILCLFAMILTTVILSYSYQIVEKRADLINGQAAINLTQADINGISGSLFIYVMTEDYYQNHRIYLKSKSVQQLHNEYDSTLSTDCAPIREVSDMYGDLNGSIYKFGNDGSIIPCGLMPASFVNFTLSVKLNGTNDLVLDSSNIAWPRDDGDRYVALENSYIDVTDSHFKVWMRSSITSTLRKFYGKIRSDDVKIGTFSFNYTEVQGQYSAKNILGYESNKKIIVSTTTRIGGKNMVLGWSFLFVAGASFMWGVIFLIIGRFFKVPSFDEHYQKMREARW